MTEFEREERALRSALNQHADESLALPDLAQPSRPRRTATVPAAAVAVAAVVVAAFAVAPGLLGRDSAEPSGAENTIRVDESQWQWIGLHALEVRAPSGWGFAHEAVRPDCIDPNDPDDSWGSGVPAAPYVTVTSLQRVVPLIGCTPPRPGNPDPAFGDLPFPLWQPYVRLDAVTGSSSQQPDRLDGQWTHEGWKLSRRTFGDVQVSVLTAPDGPDITEQVFASARTVETNHVGCETTSPFGEGFPSPSGAPVPPAADVQAIAICDYSRIDGAEGLQGSWLMTGQPARDLTSAILASPAGQGPDKPQDCAPDLAGDSALALRFLGDDGVVLADAYLYSQWCSNNGIVTSAGSHPLTRQTCVPVFSRPEVTWWSGQAQVMRLCRP